MLKSASEKSFSSPVIDANFFERLHFLELEMEKTDFSSRKLSQLVELYAVRIQVISRQPLNISTP